MTLGAHLGVLENITTNEKPTWMCQEVDGSMVSKWIIIIYNLLINGIYWSNNPLILTFDPTFQRDQVANYFHGHMDTRLKLSWHLK